MAEDSAGNRRVPIDAQMRLSFRRNAAAALRRRSDRYLSGMAMSMAQWPIIGACGLLGIYYWGWTPLHLLVLMIAGAGLAIVADLLRWLIARRSMLAEYQAMQDDRLVWLMVAAQQAGRDGIAADQLGPKSPGLAILFDFAVGALAIYFLLQQVQSMGLDLAGVLQQGGSLRAALIAVCVAPVCTLLAALSTSRRSEEHGYDELESRAGGRGVGLLLLSGALAYFGDDQARTLMIVMYSGSLIVGLLAMFGVALMYSERAWLSRHLASTSSPITADPDATSTRAPRSNKRKR